MEEQQCSEPLSHVCKRSPPLTHTPSPPTYTTVVVVKCVWCTALQRLFNTLVKRDRMFVLTISKVLNIIMIECTAPGT